MNLISALFSIVSLFNLIYTKETKIIIDNDAGADDAMAIFLTLLNEKHFNGPELLGLTTGNGNTNEENVCKNNQRILKVAKRQDVPIYRGSKNSIVITPVTNNYYGKDGLGDAENDDTNLVPAKEISAVSTLLEMSKKYEGKLIVATIGTLSNVALALKMDPDFINRLEHLYIGAGNIHNDANPSPEFNALMDVEAYHIVIQNATPDKVTVFHMSQTKASLNLTKEWRTDVLGAIDSDIIRKQNEYERISIPKTEQWQLLDPSVLAVAIKPDLMQDYKFSKNGIITCGENRGINTNTFVEKDEANVRLVYWVKTEEYRKFLFDVFSADANKST